MRRNLLLLLLICSTCAQAGTLWQKLAPGLNYRVIRPVTASPNHAIHAFKIDPKHYDFRILLAKENGNSSDYVSTLARKSTATLAINGGFFNAKWQPLGLRISDSKKISPLRRTTWWGAFYIKNQTPRIVSYRSLLANRTKRLNFAIQSGPRLVVNGYVPKLKAGLSERSAIGITRDGQVILLSTDHLPMTTRSLGKLMSQTDQRAGLNCRYAINLDGGKSSQLYANTQSMTLNIPGLSPVTDAIAIFPKK